MRVMVTGCFGYIGSLLSEWLMREGHTVIGVDNLSYGPQQYPLAASLCGDERFKFYHADVRDKGVRVLAQEADVIIPLAAIVGEPACRKHPDADVFAVNTVSVIDLVKSLSPSQTVIWPNTNSGYGASDADVALTEEAPLNPVSWYGKTKCWAEPFVLDHPRGCSLRLATVYGLSNRMRFDLLVNDFIRTLCFEGELKLYEANYVRSIVGINDVCEAFLHAIEKKLHGCFNVAQDNLSKEALGKIIAHEVGVPVTGVRQVAGHDPDQRNYKVSSAKLLATGFQFERDLYYEIPYVLNLCRSLPSATVAGMVNTQC